MSAIIVIAGSMGSFEPLRTIVAAFSASCTASVFIVSHIGPHPSVLPFLLTRAGSLPARFGLDFAVINPGQIYVAPPDQHMLLENGFIRLSDGPKVHHTRPAADPLFLSAAATYGKRVVGIVLSGGDGDGAQGLRAIKGHGGVALVQHPDEADKPSMPIAALVADHPDDCLSVEGLVERLREFCGSH